MANQARESSMESIKITQELAYSVKAATDENIFSRWNEQNCEATLAKESKGMLRLDLYGTVNERSELRHSIFDALKKAQRKRSAAGKKDELIILEAQIPSNRCGFVIGTDGETIKKAKAESGVHMFYIDENGWQSNKVNRDPRRNYSWLIISAFQVEKVIAAWEKVEELLDLATKLDPHGLMNVRSRNAGGDEQNDSNTKYRMRIPAADYFTDEQRNRFKEIKENFYGQVKFDLESSDPGEQHRFVMLSGTECKVLLAKMDLKALIKEIKIPIHATNSKPTDDIANPNDGPPSPPAPPGLESKLRKTINASPAKNIGAPTDPTQAKKFEQPLFKKELLVPAKCVVHVIGNGGETIKQIREKFGVKMQFLGDNYMDYPNGRTLSIVGDSKEKVEKARDHVDQEFILKRWDALNTNQHDIDCSDSACDEVFHMSPGFAMRENLEADMKKMKDQSGIISYMYRGTRNGHRPVVLKGTNVAIEKARQMLTQMEKEWSSRRSRFNSMLCDSRAKSLDDISLTTFDASLSSIESWTPKKSYNDKVSTTAETRQPSQNGFMKSSGGTSKANSSNGAKGKWGNNGQQGGRKWSEAIQTDQEEEEEQISVADDGSFGQSSRPRARDFSQSRASTTTVTGGEQQKSEEDPITDGIAKLLDIYGSTKEKEFEAKHANMFCIQCGISQRVILYAPCMHLLYCKQCGSAVKNCPICKCASRKHTVVFK